jgi:glycosyltransferase involved in cell wall biosynthesis
VLAMADSRVMFLESEESTNKWPAATRNRALAKARGDYVAFLDSDDEWFPTKLAKQVEYLEANPNCVFVASNANDVSPTGEVVGTEFDEPRIPRAGADAWRVLLKYSFVETSSVMARLSAIQQIGGFDPALFVSQDQDLWIRLALLGDVGIIVEVLGQIHQVASGHMTRNRLRQMDIMLPMIERHVGRLASRLSRDEIDGILGHRYQIVGRAVFLDRQYLAGLRLLAKASARSGNWLGNFFYVCHANPVGISLKKRLKSALAAAPVASD